MIWLAEMPEPPADALDAPLALALVVPLASADALVAPLPLFDANDAYLESSESSCEGSGLSLRSYNASCPLAYCLLAEYMLP
jgi:hypothetical protein